MQKKFGLSNLKKQPIKDISTIPCYIIKENLIFDALYFLQGLMANRKDIGIRMAKSELLLKIFNLNNLSNKMIHLTNSLMLFLSFQIHQKEKIHLNYLDQIS
ncbi:unnamed protein product (macronuclear) [Paramecium tetraurelia]|uniref:Uncharacterized protein n=1 Tax=Paramecium tetraurelia TaxID=5888 RepID=A0DKK3_PARTE|nr:uncharacterized protein GSPATT00017900001 [Paramecium tetraurelia]CAK83570.1 unnamed protein product [Paramecium tetraurelia]|eukprot:XP_001450967.1 hypothetical protein (macronuclear) [Paramecium tetraurelia strain d4-2]